MKPCVGVRLVVRDVTAGVEMEEGRRKAFCRACRAHLAGRAAAVFKSPITAVCMKKS